MLVCIGMQLPIGVVEMIYNMVEEIWLIQHKERFDKSLDRIRTMYRLYQEDNRYEIENNGLDIDSVPLFAVLSIFGLICECVLIKASVRLSAFNATCGSRPKVICSVIRVARIRIVDRMCVTFVV